MARNGSGTYSVVNTFVSGQTITASSHNQNWTDIGAEITNSVAADGQTTMTAPLKGSNGAVGAPTFTFASDTDTGSYRIGANNWGVAVGGTKILDVTSGGLTVTGTLTATTLSGPISGLDIVGSTAFTDLALGDSLPAYDLSATANKHIVISDVLKVINLVTEDTSPDSANDFLLSYDTSATAAKKVKPQNLPTVLPRGYIDGCAMTNGTDATNDIDIAAGVCRDSTNTVNITVAAMAGKQLDANWAPGAAAGMRNSGAGITNTTYHIYAVAKADGTQDIYAHTSTTVATVLTALQAETGGASYIYARIIGSIIRASNSILAFIQDGDEFQLVTPTLDINNATPGTSANTGTLTVPLGVRVLAYMNVYTQAAGGAYLSCLDQTDSAPSTSAAPLITVGSTTAQVGVQVRLRTNTSAQIRYRSAANSAIVGVTLGWQHPRGKNA